MLAAGTSLGPYEVRALLGAGGMGEVYLAWDPRLRREVAVKVLLAGVVSDPDRVRRFEQEARAAGGLNHPNVLAVYDVGSHDGAPYVVSERLQGETLRARLTAGDFTPRRSLECAVQIARGLAAAHERGIVHRDLKPENVFICRDGGVKILDFGIAKLVSRADGSDDETISRVTLPGVVAGTAGYMSPEQVRGQPVDARSDIFALGVVLYEMLSGRRPFRGDSRAEVQSAILREEPEPLPMVRGISGAVDRIVKRCLEKRPEDRFDTAKDVALSIDAASAATGETVPVRERGGRSALVTAAIVAALVLAGAGLGAVLRDLSRPPTAPPMYTQLTFRRGTIANARFAPDGETVVYSAAWDGQPVRIFTTRIGGRESRDFGVDGVVLNVAPTGDVALHLVPRLAFGVAGTLAHVSLSGGSPREVLDDVLAADWDAAGRDLAVVRRNAEETLLEYPIGTVVHRTSGAIGAVRTLPDGRMAIAERIDDLGDKPYAVSVVDRGGGRRVLSAGWVESPALAWSPATNEIFFTGTTGGALDLHAVSLAGRTRLVARVPGDFWLQDVDRRGRVLMTRNIPRGGVLVRRSGEPQEYDLSWLDFSFAVDISADGRQLLISDIGGGFGKSGGIALRKTDGTPPVVLGEGSPLGLSPDGRYVLAFPDLTGTADRLLLIPVGAGERRELRHPSLSHLLDAAWFADSRRIVVLAGEDERRTRLYVWDVDNTAPPRAISPEGKHGKPVVTPDGEGVTAARAGATLVRYSVGGAAEGPIRGGLVDDEPLRFSSDGRWLFVRRGRGMPARIERLEIATATRTLWRELEPSERAGVFGITSVVVTPDGSSYAYTFASALGTLYLAEGIR